MEGMKLKKIVVLGITGMAGHVVKTYLDECNYDVYGAARSAVNTNKTISLDVSDFKKLEEWLDEVNPDVIVNCIGILNKDAEMNPHKAILFNSYLPHWLVIKYKESKTKIIHISTDCVFSGSRGGYREDSIPDGRTVYDRSKALGEIRNDKDLTFRMSIIGPDTNENGIGLFNWFMKQTGTINGFTNAIWNGVTTIELAHAINEAIKVDLKGLYHLTPKMTISKHDLLNLFKEVFNRTDITVVPKEDFILDKSLVNTRSDFEYNIPSYKEMIKEMRVWIDNHSEMFKYIYILENKDMRK